MKPSTASKHKSRRDLSMSEIAAGMNHAIKNAVRLHDDARIMLDAERYPTAFALAVLAVEEFGKLAIFRRMATAQNPDDWDMLWKDFNRHTAKNIGWPALDTAKELMEKGPVKLEDLKPVFTKGTTHPGELDRAKQSAFYVDRTDQNTWTTPNDIVGKDQAANMVRIAGANIGERTREVTTLEIELWRDIIGPAPTPDRLVDWYDAMQTAGLFAPGPNLMDAFVHRGLQVASTNAPD